jgi:hypothetical protein
MSDELKYKINDPVIYAGANYTVVQSGPRKLKLRSCRDASLIVGTNPDDPMLTPGQIINLIGSAKRESNEKE